MSGKSPLVASDEQRDGLKRPLSGWKSTAIGDVIEVRDGARLVLFIHARRLGWHRATPCC
jgi:hypothetical protein